MKAYCDGSCSMNGFAASNGSFGYVVLDDNDKVIDAYTSERVTKTSNNRQEMLAIIFLLNKYGLQEEELEVYTDSAYAYNTFTKWIYDWQKNGWLTSKGYTPENIDLVKEYWNFIEQGYRINLKKVRGHCGDFWNEIADKLATKNITPEEVLAIDKE